MVKWPFALLTKAKSARTALWIHRILKGGTHAGTTRRGTTVINASQAISRYSAKFFWLCHGRFYCDAKRMREEDHMPDEAVNGSVNHRLRGSRARVRQMVITIDPNHARAHFHWLTAQYRNIYSGCVPLCRGPDQLLAALWQKLNYAVCLNLSRNPSSVTPPHRNRPPPSLFRKHRKSSTASEFTPTVVRGDMKWSKLTPVTVSVHFIYKMY